MKYTLFTTWLIVLLIGFTASVSMGQVAAFKIAKLKYGGGGDWYANKTALPNLIKFSNTTLKLNIHPEEEVVEPGSSQIFSYPYVYMTGHGNVHFTPTEAQNIRRYLQAGGFLHIDDNYGLNEFIHAEMKKVFPELSFQEIPFQHPIYHQKYKFANGLPKIHEHDGKPAQGFGLFWEGKLVCFYSYESDLGNGWEDQQVHNNPQEVRELALQMGCNILSFACTTF